MGRCARLDPPAESRRRVPRFETPIVPQTTIAGRALVAVVAIMTFLASLTTGAALLVRAAANEWQSDVAREVTIQVRPAAGRDIEAEIAKAAAIARASPGVAAVRPYSQEESARLLEPWLGSGLQLDDLPVPRLIVVRIAPGAAPDLAQLREMLAEQVPAQASTTIAALSPACGDGAARSLPPAWACWCSSLSPRCSRSRSRPAAPWRPIAR